MKLLVKSKSNYFVAFGKAFLMVSHQFGTKDGITFFCSES